MILLLMDERNKNKLYIFIVLKKSPIKKLET